jgi:hypothetical protein
VAVQPATNSPPVRVAVQNRRYLLIGSNAPIDLGTHAALRPLETTPPAVDQHGVVRFRFSLASDIGVPGSGDVVDELLLGAVDQLSALVSVLKHEAADDDRGAGDAAADAAAGSGDASAGASPTAGGVGVMCGGCGAPLLQPGHPVTRFLPMASAGLEQVLEHLTCSGPLSSFLATARMATPGVCMVGDSDLGLCDGDVMLDALLPLPSRSDPPPIEDGRVAVGCVRCRWLLGAAQWGPAASVASGSAARPVRGVVVHQCAVLTVPLMQGDGDSAAAAGTAAATGTPRARRGGALLDDRRRAATTSFIGCAARALLSTTVTHTIQRIMVVPASAPPSAGVGAAGSGGGAGGGGGEGAPMSAARLCLWLVSPVLERMYGSISTIPATAGAVPSTTVLRRALKLYYLRLGYTDQTPAGWEDQVTVRTVVWPHELVVVVTAALLGSTQQHAAPGSRVGPAGFKVGYLPLE